MMKFLDSIVGWIVAALVAMMLLLSWGVDHYRSKAAAAVKDLQQLQADVREQKRTAQKTLDRLTGERDQAQAELKQHRQQQEKTDEAAKQEIARLGDELKQRPVRVRIVAAAGASGPGGGGTPGAIASPSDASAGDPAETYGLLPPGNSARLGAVITEIETINAAYASCRAQLFHQIDKQIDNDKP